MKLAYDVYETDSVKEYLPPIILHHGISSTRKNWKNLGKPLAQNTGRKVYALDARHHGDSPWTGEYNYELMVEDLDEFLVDHGIPKIILIGHSMGGKVAIGFALRKPEKVVLLIIEEVPVRNFTFHRNNLIPTAVNLGKEAVETLKQMGKEEAENYIREMAKLLSDMVRMSAEMIESYDMELLPIKWNGKFYEPHMNYKIVAEAILSDKLQLNLSGKYEGDTLFIYGTISQFKVDKDSMIEKYFPRAIKVGLKGAGHFVHDTFPQEFLKVVCDFINRQEGLMSKY